MWIRLLAVKFIEVQGKLTRHNPGDWVSIGKQTALGWIAANDAEIPPSEAHTLLGTECGIVALGPVTDPMKDLLRTQYDGALSLTSAVAPCLPFERTLIWDPSLALRPELLPAGFALLAKWQVAVPLCDYDILAANIGTWEDRAQTKTLMHNLQVMVYDPRLVFVQRCADTQRVIDAWAEETEKGDDARLAFLRAVYRTVPIINALPMTWTGATGPTAG